MPDPVELVAQLFGDRVRAHAARPPVAGLRQAFPGGYVALQLSTEFADDATSMPIAQQLGAVADRTGLGVVLFRAGAAPWHDDRALLARLAHRLGTRKARLFDSLDVWDLCALLAQARAALCSSLHGVIVARAFGVPALAIESSAPAQGRKLAAYLSTWHAQDTPVLRPPCDIGARLWDALAPGAASRQARAGERASRAGAALRGLIAPP
jgi:hypothetical protein